MGTPCAIGMKMADGSVKAIRYNYDGYVAGAGVILGGWYKDAAKVADLLALGELSQLSEELASCIAYHRDCHEPMRPAVRFANIESYRRCAKGGMSADYLYLYDDGEWLVYGLYHEPNWVKMEIKKMKKISIEEMMDALSRCESCTLDLSEATEQEIQKEYMLLRKIGLLKASGEPPANLRRTSGEPPAGRC